MRTIHFDGLRWSVVQGPDLIITPDTIATDLISICMNEETDGLIINKDLVHSAFFDLKSKIAGEILQKFSTYGYKLIIAGEFDSTMMKESLTAFIRESNRIGNIRFMNADSF